MEEVIIKAKVQKKDVFLLETLLKRINGEIIIDDENTYTEVLAEKIRKGREEKEKGETKKLTSADLWEILS